jgi:predicted Zn-ribbon and HTH transcriptional regulator
MNKRKKALENLEKIVSDMGKELGMPPLEDDDPNAFTSNCTKCGWKGHAWDVVFKDGNFQCPSCNNEFLPREE